MKDKISNLIKESLLSEDPITTGWSWIILSWLVCIFTWFYHTIFIFTDYNNGTYIGILIFIGFMIVGIIRAIKYWSNF